eukprot:175829-Pyramimonas_sp.AAC.5
MTKQDFLAKGRKAGVVESVPSKGLLISHAVGVMQQHGLPSRFLQRSPQGPWRARAGSAAILRASDP